MRLCAAFGQNRAMPRANRLAELDLDLSLKRKEESARLTAGGVRLTQLRLALGGLLGRSADEQPDLGPAVCVLIEGWDASGKGGAIKRLVAPMDPRHVRVAQFAAPTADQKRHHFLHRFEPAVPGLGGMAVFDRTWYGRVLVERVEGFATEDQWRRAYDEINNFESLLVNEGTVLIKFWMHISEQEQLERFERRQKDPLKSWKLTDEDWRNRDKRAAYEAAIEDMLERTDTTDAPWHLVEGDSKRWARVRVMETVIGEIERGCAARGFELPAPLPEAEED